MLSPRHHRNPIRKPPSKQRPRIDCPTCMDEVWLEEIETNRGTYEVPRPCPDCESPKHFIPE